MTTPLIKRLLAPAGLLLLVAIAYGNTLDVPFVRDDILRIVNDPAIRDFPACLAHTARPLVNATLHLNYRLGGFSTPGYHLVNIILHLAATGLLYAFVRQSLRLSPEYAAPNRSATAAAFAVAAIWAVHPIQTETVTYVIQRAECLVSLFMLGSLLALSLSKTSTCPQCWLVVSLTSALAAMTCKPVAVTLPLAALLYDRAFLGGTLRAAIRQRRGYYIGMSATWLVLGGLLLQSRESFASAGFTAKLISPWQYLLTQASVIPHYLGLIIWPFDLCFDHAWPAALSLGGAWLPLLGLALLVLVTVALHARWPRMGFMPLIFLLVLSPTSSIIPLAHYAVEHRLYLPSAGFIAFSIVGMARLGAIWQEPSLQRCFRLTSPAVLALILFSLTILTIKRNDDYRDPERLWRSVLKVRPTNTLARVALAGELLKNGRYDESASFASDVLCRLSFLSTMDAVQLDHAVQGPRGYEILDKAQQYVDALNCLGFASFMQNRLMEAESYLRRAVRLMPRSVSAHHNLAAIHGRLGQPERALDEWNEILRIQPRSPLAYTAIGNIRQRQGNTAEAARAFRAALEIDPAYSPAAAALKSLSRNPPERASER